MFNGTANTTNAIANCLTSGCVNSARPICAVLQ